MGDMKNSIERLRKLLKTTRYPPAQATTGDFAVADLLRILHHALLDYSRHVAGFILEKGYDLYGKTDARFIDRCFRLMRDEFEYFPSLNATQFLSNQFLERKIQLVGDILDLVAKKHDACVRRRRQDQAVWTKPRELKSNSTHVQNHVMPPPESVAPQPSAIDTWSLLQHFRQEAKTKARERKQLSQQHRHHASTTANDHSRSAARLLVSPTKSSRSNNLFASSGSTGSPSETELDDNQHSHGDSSPTPHRTSAHAACACGCSETKSEVQQVLVTLSSQISDLTSAVLSRVSSIEMRLGRVEQQLLDLQVAKTKLQTPHSQPQQHNPQRGSSAVSGDDRTSASKCPRRFETSWPPDPDMLDQH